MAVTVRLPGALRDATGGQTKLEASAGTLADVISDIDRRHPGFRSRVLDDSGAHPHLRQRVHRRRRRAHAGRHRGGRARRQRGHGHPGDGRRRSIADALWLRPAIRDELFAHAREEAPREACGLLAGRDGGITRVIRCANVHPTPTTRYVIDPREQLKAFRAIDAAGEELRRRSITAIRSASRIHRRRTAPRRTTPTRFYVLLSLRDRPSRRSAPSASAPDDFIREVPIAVERRSLARRLIDSPRRGD